MSNFNIHNLIRCKFESIASDKSHVYSVIPATPATGILYITQHNSEFISGHIRMRGRDGGRYPYNYLEMIDHIFGKEENTIEVCSGSIKGRNATLTAASIATMEESKSSLSSIAQLSSFPSSSCFTVDINPDTNPDLIADGQTLDSILRGIFSRWRGDPPYNPRTAKEMYGTDLPSPLRLLKAGARVCKPGSLMFLLLGPKNYQICPIGVKRLGWIAITIVPNNELRTLHIFYKYGDPISTFMR